MNDIKGAMVASLTRFLDAVKVDGSTVCPECGGKRYAEILLDGSPHLVRCLCPCQAEREREREREQAKARKLAGLRPAPCGTFDGSEPSEPLGVCRKWAEGAAAGVTRFGLILYGPPGEGKTHAAACVCNELRAAGIACEWATVYDLTEFDADLARYVRAPFLVLDDLGAQRSTEYAGEAVARVVDARYSRNLPTVVTTNWTREQMARPDGLGGVRCVSRLVERCLLVPFDTGRKRATKKGQETMRKALR